MGKESVFKVAVAFEKFALDYSKYHLNTAEPSKKITRQKMGSVAIGCLYKDLHELLLNNRHVGDKTETSRYVNTRIITAAVDPKHEKLRQDVILKFRNLKVDEGEKQCMFWSGLGKSLDGFSGDGCYVDPSKSNSKDTVCRCNHLTHFAVLVDIRDDPELSTRDVNVLEIITYIGLSLSITGFLLTITLYFFLTDVRQPLPQIRLGLSVSLGAGQTIFLAGINATENKALCITSAVLMQYFLMAAFGWMLVEGNYLYLFVVKVYNINTKMYLYHVMSWDQHFDTRSGHKGDDYNAAKRRKANAANTIREKFNRKVNTVFPSVSNGNSTKKSSQDNPSDVNERQYVIRNSLSWTKWFVFAVNDFASKDSTM
ncbi:EGF, latrophilin and seven transmembrane domain-containing protein 1 [Stylophora pistillata]|uniref:EGF, latrophilin and seven transmembrane domain-containing protein 1 n=1 Tax=Stylophora pistillata TaxID=50429 RepID=A0A2B4SF52_STYPI|nr:EGF, latrophilin and seven transmembrane domain-containing protein 1 [Stylophora pistillata]